MAKTTTSTDPLSHYWCPPTELLDGGVGESVSCIATTFEFDAGFYETELLPRFLGLKFDHTENETTFLIEREDKLARTNTAVLVDIHRIDPGQTTLRWDQVPISVPGAQSIQHAKIVLLVWERLIRLIVGSGNLTRPGYRRNREVFAALDFWDDPESVPRAPLYDAISLLERILGWSRVPDGTRDRTLGSLVDARARLAGWQTTPADFRPRQKPRVSFVATCPPSAGARAKSAIDEVIAEWGSRSVTDLTVFTPFVGEPSGNGDQVVAQLTSLRLSRECTGWLVLPRSPGGESDDTVRVPFPDTFGRHWNEVFGSRGGGQFIALPLNVTGVDKVNRTLHSKLLALEDAERSLLMIGSSNFTPHGMGVGVFNVEANLLFEETGNEMWQRIELPVDWDTWVAAEDVQWSQDAVPAEDTVDKTCLLPRFFAWACYSQISGTLRLRLDRSQVQPTAWSVRLKGVETEALNLFDHTSAGSGDELSFTFPHDQRTATLSSLAVEWPNSDGRQCEARLIVSVVSKDDLAPPGLFKGFGVDAMIECLIRGQSLAEWQERHESKKRPSAQLYAALDSLRSIDTSEYVLYRVRRFGRALSGLCERLERTALIPTAVQYRLFKDPLGPSALAEALTGESDATAAGTFAALSHEHRVFFRAELFLIVAHAFSRMLKRADAKTKRWLSPLVHEALGKLTPRTSDVGNEVGPQSPGNMAVYVRDVLKEVTSVIGPLSKEVADAR
jgi:hypothetical protein